MNYVKDPQPADNRGTARRAKDHTDQTLNATLRLLRSANEKDYSKLDQVLQTKPSQGTSSLKI